VLLVGSVIVPPADGLHDHELVAALIDDIHDDLRVLVCLERRALRAVQLIPHRLLVLGTEGLAQVVARPRGKNACDTWKQSSL
jgi:hypothetical protein